MPRPKKYNGLKCKIGGCNRPATTQYMCLKCYHAWWRKQLPKVCRRPIKRERLLRMAVPILLGLNDARAQKLGDDIKFALRAPPYNLIKQHHKTLDQDYELLSIVGDLDEAQCNG